MFKYYDHLLGMDSRKFSDHLKWLPETKVCRVDRFGCGEEVHISRFIHRQRIRDNKYTVEVDLICKDCVSKKKKTRKQNPIDDSGVKYGHGLSRKFADTGPVAGSLDRLFFCKR
jgi:hypothetical protein